MPIGEPLQQVVRAQSPQPEMSHFAGDIGMTGHQLAGGSVVPLRVNECKFRMIPPADAFRSEEPNRAAGIAIHPYDRIAGEAIAGGQ